MILVLAVLAGDGIAQLLEALGADATYCRITPRFEVPAGAHEWLARTVFVGTGERRGARSIFDYYAVT